MGISESGNEVDSDKLPRPEITHLSIVQGPKHKTAKPGAWTATCCPSPEPQKELGNISLTQPRPWNDEPDFPAKRIVKNSNTGSDL